MGRGRPDLSRVGRWYSKVFYRGVISRLHRVLLRSNHSLHNSDITESLRLDRLC
jgi:hypothetical protein